MYCKLTDQSIRTHNSFQWELNEWYEIPNEDREDELCSPGFFHCYDNPVLAVIFSPIHVDFSEPRLFEVEVGGESKEDRGVKFGFTRMRLMREVELPTVTLEQRVEFAIRCAAKVYEEKSWTEWAENWLSGEDRSADAAYTAARTARADKASAAAAYAAYAAGAAAKAAAYAYDVIAKVAANAVANASTVNFAAIIKEILK